MASLAAADVVGIWEAGSNRPAWNKALVALAPSFPEADPAELAALSIGERNARLLALRQEVIGPVIQAVVTCPKCGEPLEFEQRIDELLDGYSSPAEREFDIAAGDYGARCRLLDSQDLAQAAKCGGEAPARDKLAERAILEAAYCGAPAAAAELPAEVVRRIADELADRDRLAELAIPLACAACEHVWPATLDITAFLWAELERKAKQILADVVAIAQAYGWREADILAMSPSRRQYYLDSIG
ncbi:MAG TPA: hypothetical protein VF662_12020 [Allosphingosinicella sp.]|jgi:hypothetical protein